MTFRAMLAKASYLRCWSAHLSEIKIEMEENGSRFIIVLTCEVNNTK